MSETDRLLDERFRTCIKSANVTPWRGDRNAKALREIDALIHEATARSRPEPRAHSANAEALAAPQLDPDTELDWF